MNNKGILEYVIHYMEVYLRRKTRCAGADPSIKIFKTLYYSLSYHPTLVIYMSFIIFAAAAAKSLQSCPSLCDPRDGSPPGSPVPGILQARTLEWVAMSFSNTGK